MHEQLLSLAGSARGTSLRTLWRTFEALMEDGREQLMEDDTGLMSSWLSVAALALSVGCIAAYYLRRGGLTPRSAPADARPPFQEELPTERARRLAHLLEAMSSEKLRAIRHSDLSATSLAYDSHFRALCSLATSPERELCLSHLVEPAEAILGHGAFSVVELRRVAKHAPCHAGELYAVKRLLSPAAPAGESAPCGDGDGDSSVCGDGSGGVDGNGSASAVPAFEVVSMMAEGALLRILQHPNIIACNGAIGARAAPAADEEVPLCALLLEHAPGGSLRQRIEAQDYSPADALGWLVGVLRALAYLHELGGGLAIIHRDLKPSNVLIGADHSVRLCDFGLFRLLPAATRSREPPGWQQPLRPPSPSKGPAVPQSPNMTARCGTLCYMAPELWASNGRYDAKVDLFAFGILAWEVLTMQLAYSDLDTPPERIGELVARRGMRPYLPPHWPYALKALLHSCLATDPVHRPSARRAFHALERFQRDALADRALCEALAVRPLPCRTVFEQGDGGLSGGGADCAVM